MSYKPYYTNGWKSGEAGGTPITPEALNHMEEGIKTAGTHADSTANPHKVTAAQVGALPKAGGTLTGDLTVGDSTSGVRLRNDNEGGNIMIYPPSVKSNNANYKRVVDSWEMDSYDGKNLRIYAVRNADNPNGQGNVFPLTIKDDGSISVGNAAKTRNNLGALSGVESTASPNCFYRTVSGATEWINPPMKPGVEYRTTERFADYPVYCKLVDHVAAQTYGSANSINEYQIPHGISGFRSIVRVDAKQNVAYPLPTLSSGGGIASVSQVTASYIYLRVKNAAFDARTWVFVLYYTK